MCEGDYASVKNIINGLRSATAQRGEQTVLASKLGVSQVFMSQIVGGNRNPFSPSAAGARMLRKLGYDPVPRYKKLVR